MALAAVAFAAFFAGRTVEEKALAARMQSNARVSQPGPAATSALSMSHQQLAVADIFALPFADFYEALRAAPGEAREKWASELAAMPDGPRRRAAVSGFYKLLVQFDPEAAVKAIGAIENEGSLRLALGAAVNAAPGFALPLMAELSLSLQDRLTGKRDYVSDVLLEWALIDPAAAIRFIGDHEKAFDELSRGRYFTTKQVLSSWAAIDPKAAKQWIDKRENEVGSETREFFIEGWYENDRAAAVSYTLTHAEEPEMSAAIGAVLRNLYFHSKDEAKKFIESLPENKKPEALQEAFRRLILLDEEATGDAAMTPQAIASWMIEFPPAYWQGALGRLFGNDERASADLLSWIQQSPPGVREAVADEYFAAFDKSPSEKIAPILQVADPVLRDRLLGALVNNQSLDFDEAKTAVSNAPLSVEQKRHFLEIVAAAKARKNQETAAREERERAEMDQGSEK
ncbi:MAG: hypothetical protein QOK24_2048 [Verrucomicrobiota bacterium]|jgi:hypothetical protein